VFRFKLEFLLRFRRQKEEMAMYELAQRIRVANQIETELTDIKEKAGRIAETCTAQAGQTVAAPVLVMYKSYQDHLRKSGKVTERRLMKAEERIEAQRGKLVEASVDRKVIEKFRDRQKECHIAESARKSQIETDELSSLAKRRRDHEEEE
jgi:flagellar FliJ protein